MSVISMQVLQEIDEVKAAVGSTPLQLVVDPTPLCEKQVEVVVEFAKKQKLPLLKLAEGFALDRYTIKI